MSLLQQFGKVFNPKKDGRSIEQIQCDKDKAKAYDAFVRLKKMNIEDPLYYSQIKIVDGLIANLKIVYGAHVDWEKNFNELEDAYWYPCKIKTTCKEWFVKAKEFTICNN